MRCCSRPSGGTGRKGVGPSVRPSASARSGGRFKGPAAALACALIAGCATVPPAVPPAPTAELASTFDLAGRFSARRGNDGVAGRFTWSHAPSSDVLVFSTPTGQALARLSGGPDGVLLESADGHTARAEDWSVLTAQAIGVPVPVDGLAWWIRGAPRPGSPHTDERDGSGRRILLRQDGWQVVYAWGEGARPVRVALSYPDIELRLALDRD